MNKSIQKLICCGLSALLLATSGQGVEAGIIPWTYNAIFGPVGSTFGPRRTFYGPMGGAAFFPSSACCNPCSSCSPCTSCNTCNYGVGYTPYYSSYVPFSGCNACSSCSSYGAFGCSSCGTGNCPSGNCGAYIPSSGNTTPQPSNGSTTPTTTFQSSKPTVNPEALEKMNTNKPGNSTYDDKEGFQQPTRSNSNDSSEAPPFNPFGSGSTESLKVPTPPLVPVEKREPAPTSEPQGNGELNVPPLRFEPAPVAIGDLRMQWERTPVATRSTRAASYVIPHVARNTPNAAQPFLPPLPAPLQLVGK